MKPWCRRRRKYSHRTEAGPDSIPTVRLHNDGDDIRPSIETWKSTHVIKEFVDPSSNERRATIQFADGVETDVCWGTLHFLEHKLRGRTKKEEWKENIPQSDPLEGMTFAAAETPNDLPHDPTFDWIYSSDDSGSDGDAQVTAVGGFTDDTDSDNSSDEGHEFLWKSCSSDDPLVTLTQSREEGVSSPMLSRR